MKLALALVATLASSCALNVGYLLEHGAVSKLPPLSIRSPLDIAAAPAREQAMGNRLCDQVGRLGTLRARARACAAVDRPGDGGGRIGILALLVSRVTHVPLTRHEWLGVVIAVAGLVLLGISLAGGHGEGGGASYLSVGLWIGASAVAALVSVQLLGGRIGAAPAYGVAAGLLFAAGDIATKGAVDAADSHLAFIAALIAAYAFGTLVLQTGFQHGSALTTAGIATLLTNALPIVAGMTIFGEPLPEGWLGAVRIAAFACVVVGAVFLGERRHPAPGEAPEPSRRPPAPEKPSAGAESRGPA